MSNYNYNNNNGYPMNGGYQQAPAGGGDVLDWNSTIINDEAAFVLLEPGDYNFTVEKMEKEFYNGSAKLPACPQATIYLRIVAPNGQAASVRDQLLLCQQMEWKLSSFFRSIGQKKHGEPLQMNWDRVVGASGRVTIKTRDYINKDGESKQANNVDAYLDPMPAGVTPNVAPGAPGQPNFTPGNF